MTASAPAPGRSPLGFRPFRPRPRGAANGRLTVYHVQARFPYLRARDRPLWHGVMRNLICRYSTHDRRRALKWAAVMYLEDNVRTRVITGGRRRIIWTSPPPRPPRCETCGKATALPNSRWCDDCLDLPLYPAALILVPDGPGTIEERVAAEVEGWRARTGMRK